MKKVLSVMAVSAFVLTASVCLAGGPGKKAKADDCQDRIDALQAQLSQKDEMLRACQQAKATPAPVKAQESAGMAYPIYVKALGKWAISSDPAIEGFELDTSDGYGFGGAVGMVFNQFRAEFEVATQKTDIDEIKLGNLSASLGSGDVRITTYMVNGFYEFPIMDGFGIYVMGGLGMGTTDVSIYNADGDDTTFAYKAGTGVSYAFTPNVAVDLGYEFLGVEDADIEGTEVTDLYSHNVVGAVRFTF